MKLYKVKAILYPAGGLAHIVFWKYLPNPVLASVIAVGLLGLGAQNIAKWVEESR